MLNQQKHPAESEVLSPDIVFFHPVDSVWDDESRVRPRLERESMSEIINGSRLLRPLSLVLF